MRFWDSSALLPLFVAEQSSVRMRALHESDPSITVWALTRVELASAMARRQRARPGEAAVLRLARLRVLAACDTWQEVTALESVRMNAGRLVLSHALRAADALQLGAALVAAAGDPSGLDFVTLDERLAQAAEREGFPVLGI